MARLVRGIRSHFRNFKSIANADYSLKFRNGQVNFYRTSRAHADQMRHKQFAWIQHDDSRHVESKPGAVPERSKLFESPGQILNRAARRRRSCASRRNSNAFPASVRTTAASSVHYIRKPCRRWRKCDYRKSKNNSDYYKQWHFANRLFRTFPSNSRLGVDTDASRRCFHSDAGKRREDRVAMKVIQIQRRRESCEYRHG